MADTTLVVVTIGSIEAILIAIRHKLLHLLPTFHGESVIRTAAVVPLRCTKGGDRNTVVLTEIFREREEIVPTLEV